MLAIITGAIFNDLHINGVFYVGEPKIPNTWVAIEEPTFVFYINNLTEQEYTVST